MSRKATPKLPLKTWNKAELADPDNWDFSFCAGWSQAGIYEVWEHEAARELGLVMNPFRAGRKRMTRTRALKQEVKRVSIASAKFFRIFEFDDAGRISNGDELVKASNQRVSLTRCLHLLEIDYQQSDRQILERFAAWLSDQRSALKLPPSGRARPQGVTSDYREWLDDLAMYRFREAKVSTSRAMRDFGFKPMVKRISANPHAAFANAHKATLKHLRSIYREDPSMADFVA